MDKWRLVIDAAVGSDRVIVVADELLEKLVKVTFIERDDMVEKLST